MRCVVVTRAPGHPFLKVGERGYVVQVDGWPRFRYSRMGPGGHETCDVTLAPGRVEVEEVS